MSRIRARVRRRVREGQGWIELSLSDSISDEGLLDEAARAQARRGLLEALRQDIQHSLEAPNGQTPAPTASAEEPATSTDSWKPIGEVTPELEQGFISHDRSREVLEQLRVRLQAARPRSKDEDPA